MYVAARVVTDRQTDIHIHKASTVTLAVHAHRGLITTYTACAHHYRLYTAHIISTRTHTHTPFILVEEDEH